MFFYLKKYVFHLLFFLGIFGIFFLPAFDTDLGWHLRYGEYFIKNKSFLLTNNLTLLLENYTWPNSYGVYQIITYLFYKLFGLMSLSFLSGIILTFSFYLIYLYLEKNLSSTILVALNIIYFSWMVFGLGWRAQLFSFLFTILLLFLLKKQKYLWSLPLLFLSWVNLHGGFSLGITILIIFLAVNIISFFRKKNLKSVFVNLIITVLSMAATLINPYSWKAWWEAWHHLQVPMKTLIAEWVPPNPFTLLIIFIIFFLCLIIIFISKNKDFNLFFLASCLIFFFIMSLNARRNIPFFFLFANFIIFGSNIIKQKLNNENIYSLSRALIILFFIFGVFIQFPKTLLINSTFDKFCSTSTMFPNPCQAVEFLKNNHLTTGNFYNTFEWGGFLEWQLPDIKYFSDGRMPAWPTPSGESPYTIYLKILQTQPGWEQTLNQYNIDHIIISPGTFMDLEIKSNKKYSWKEIYRDDRSVIYEH